jgi:fructose-1,6-bisphosphatase/inositol monophosphatase family enzyme
MPRPSSDSCSAYSKFRMDFINISKKLYSSLYINLTAYRKRKGLYGLQKTEDHGVKATHKIDEVAFEIIQDELKGLPINLYMEGFEAIMGKDPLYNFYIDPVDGSRNWDRGVGDPCFCLAVSENKPTLKYSDLCFAFIGGYHSRDQYYLKDGKAYYESATLERGMEISTSNCAEILSNAHAYLKAGYSASRKHFAYCYPIYELVKDIRAIDNSGMDLCEIARSAADFSIEARELSDFYNLLAYPIFHAAGGIITDLKGNDLYSKEFDMDGQYDFIAAGNRDLLGEILENVKK